MVERFNEFISESYSYKKESEDDIEIKYSFKNRDNVKLVVVFKLIGDEEYERTYHIESEKYGRYDELRSNDSINIIKTLTNITVSFIGTYQPEEVIINHIPSQKEILRFSEHEDSDFWKTYNTKRANVNKRYIERKIPFGYFYELKGMTSHLVKEVI